jgi:hypothetical protein
MDALSGLVVRDSGTCDRKERNSNMTHEIDALEGEALAAAVATRVMGWENDDGWWSPPDIVPGAAIETWRWRPDQGIAQAFEAVDKVAELHPEWWFRLGEHENLVNNVFTGPTGRLWRAMWFPPSDHPVYSVYSDHADRRIAICRACLKAVGEAQL